MVDESLVLSKRIDIFLKIDSKGTVFIHRGLSRGLIML